MILSLFTNRQASFTPITDVIDLIHKHPHISNSQTEPMSKNMNLVVAAGSLLAASIYIFRARPKRPTATKTAISSHVEELKHENKCVKVFQHKPHKEELCEHTCKQLVTMALEDHVIIGSSPLIDMIVDYWGYLVLEDYSPRLPIGFVLSYPKDMTYNPTWKSCIDKRLCVRVPGTRTFLQEKCVGKGLIGLQWFIKHLNSIRLKYEPLIACPLRLGVDEKTAKIRRITLTITPELSFVMQLYLQQPHTSTILLHHVGPVAIGIGPTAFSQISDDWRYGAYPHYVNNLSILYNEEWISLSSILDPSSDWFYKEIHDPIAIHSPVIMRSPHTMR